MGKSMFKDAVKYVGKLKRDYRNLSRGYAALSDENLALHKQVSELKTASDQSDILAELAELQRYCLELKKENELIRADDKSDDRLVMRMVVKMSGGRMAERDIVTTVMTVMGREFETQSILKYLDSHQ